MTAYPKSAAERPDPDSLVVVDSASGRWLPGTPTPRLVSEGRGHAWQMHEGIWRLAEPEDDEEAVYRSVRIQRGRTVCIGEGCTATMPGPIREGHVYTCPSHVAAVWCDPEDVTGDAGAPDEDPAVSAVVAAQTDPMDRFPWSDGHSFYCGIGQPARDCPGAVRSCDCRCHALDAAQMVPVPDTTTVLPDPVDKSTGTSQDAVIEVIAPMTRQPGRTAGRRTAMNAPKNVKAAAKSAVAAGLAGILAGTTTADAVLADTAVAAVIAPQDVLDAYNADVAAATGADFPGTDAPATPAPKPTTRAAANAARSAEKRAAVKADAPARAAKATKPAPAPKPAKAAKPKAVKPAAAPVTPAESPVAGPVVLLTIAQVDAIIASADVPLMTALNTTGRWVRPNGSAPSGKATQPSTDPVVRKQYAPRWRLAVPATTPGLDALATLATVSESARGAARLRPVADLDALRAAKALVAKVDGMPGPEAVKASGTDEVQSALEVIAKASVH